uniref:Disease resistance RPP13-like protein 1 n=1 Tax=Cajanus cajan TaxID=3821 RepID=A0A151QV45_CAJCA|nr:Putative disease resistance RPP13-like protein 1 [Cajanus cajan]
MAAELVGGAFLSAFIQTLFEKMATRDMLDFIRGVKHDNGLNLLDKLKITLRSIDALVNHAEERQTTDLHTREWLNDLKDVMFKAEDLLDKISVLASNQKLEADSWSSSISSKVCCSSLGGFSEEMESIIHRIENLVKQKDVLGLREGVNEKTFKNFQTTSLAGKSSIYGRNADKDNVIKLLLSVSNDASDKICVIPIVGMGGVGKTTLAQHVYNDDKVKQHFDIKVWVCVNQEFDVFKLTKTILEAIPLTCDTMDLNLLQVKLKEFLHRKRFLIVLDDVWNESYIMWEILRRPFEFGAQGSCVLVTTRNENVASTMLTIPSYHLKPLEDYDCWLLFSEHAFEGGRFIKSAALDDIGRKIVKKCKGLPLAAKALGGLLRSKVDSRAWVKVLESKIWDFPNDRSNILPALMLSYYYLPSTLKRCFAYCSVFPKSYQFRRKELVRLWMAEDLLPHPKGNGNVEELGTEYFNDLTSRSFFIKSSKKRFVMHDLITDLAEFVSGAFSFRLEGHKDNYLSKRTRHLSYSRLHLDDLEKIMATCENLRTFLPSQVLSWPKCLNNEAVSSLISKHRSLRVLSLSHCGNLTVVPDFLGDLIHLRYLDLSVTPISKLPESTCSLHNLQTLLLLNCVYLTELPQQIGRLTNLRCLDIRGTKLSETPLHMGNLTNLQNLTGYVLGSGGGSGIEELKNFSFLKGKISISNLQNIIDPQDALKDKLLRNMQLDGLMLSWSTNADDSKNVRNILHWLEPPKTLKKLTIRNYGSTSFPPWLGDFQFSKLVSICLYDCVNCLILPTLGQLPSLKALSLVGFSSVIYVDEMFYNDSSMEVKRFQRQDITPFKCLETLHFENMPRWQEWLPFKEEEKGDEKRAFPCLKQLYIKNCPELKVVNLIQKLPALEKIVIAKCEQLVVAVPPTIRELRLECCEKVSIQRPLPQLLNLTISSYNAVHCNSLRSFIMDMFPKMVHLEIRRCQNLESLVVSGVQAQNLRSLSSLKICECPNFVSFPEERWLLPSTLTSFHILALWNLKYLDEDSLQQLTSLETLGIACCPKLQCMPAKLPASISTLHIMTSPRLEERCKGKRAEDWPKIAHIPMIRINKKLLQ